MLSRFIFVMLISLLPIMAMSRPADCNFADTIVITDADCDPGNTPLHLTAENLYVLVGHVFVEDGCEIIIDPGTVIWGTSPLNADYGPAEANPGALIISRGGKINAQGTYNNPIIMTCVYDDVCDPDDFGYNDRQLWGGLIVLGKALVNTATGDGHIEGIPLGEPRADYGGNDDADSSGVMTYISLRHGGHEIGDANEINGVTMGAMGYKTVMHHIEVFSNYDDGYEWFGGDVNVHHLVSAYNGDDCFDMDEGIRGNFQFIFAMYTDSVGDKNGEHDGGTDPECGLPFANPIFYNATYVGRGANPDLCNNKTSNFHIRDNWAGKYNNSLFIESSCWAFYEIENLDAGYADPDGTCDSEQRLRIGDIKFSYNMFDGHGTDVTDYVNSNPDKEGYQHVLDYFNGVGDYATSADNETGPSNSFGNDPLLVSLSWRDGPHEELDPRLQSGSPAIGGISAVEPAGFIDVDYKGAFPEYDDTDPCNNWLAYWTYMYEKRIVPQQAPFISGDANGNGVINILDITYLISYLYKGGSAPANWMKAGDPNGNNVINILDITYLISFLYKGGPSPIGC